MICSVLGEDVFYSKEYIRRILKKWDFSENLNLEDEKRPGQPKKVEDEELEEFLEKNFCHTLSELTDVFGITRPFPNLHKLKRLWKKDR